MPNVSRVAKFSWPIHRVLVFEVVIVVLFSLSGYRADAVTLYGVSWNASEIFEIDLGTGAATLVGTTPLIDLGGIAFNEFGVLYAVDGGSTDTDLYILNPSAGTATFIGSAGVAGGEGALVYDPVAGFFYSKANNAGTGPGGLGLELITIDPLTGLGTVIGNLGLNQEADISGLALLSDGTLLGYDAQSLLMDQLLTLDKVTGLASINGPTADGMLSSLGGLAVHPETGVLYLSNAFNLFEVDPVTGAATLIGSHGQPITGLSFKPTPACLIGLDALSNLHDVNHLDGVGTNVRATGVDGLGGLALAPSGTLYALRAAAAGELYTLDIATGVASSVGLVGFAAREGGLDFDPISGNLYGANGATAGALYTLDTMTGAATVLGVVLDEFGQGIDVSALAFDAAGILYVLKMTTAPEIYRISPADGTVFDRVLIPGFVAGAEMGGMEFDDATGVLYVSIAGQLVTLDPGTGATTLLGVAPATSALEVTGACLPAPLTTLLVPSQSLWSLPLLLAAMLVVSMLLAARSRPLRHQ